jgi:hypothetical protein
MVGYGCAEPTLRVGAIVGLLALSALLELHPLPDFMSDLGDELLKNAHISGRGASRTAGVEINA